MATPSSVSAQGTFIATQRCSWTSSATDMARGTRSCRILQQKYIELANPPLCHYFRRSSSADRVIRDVDNLFLAAGLLVAVARMGCY